MENGTDDGESHGLQVGRQRVAQTHTAARGGAAVSETIDNGRFLARIQINAATPRQYGLFL